MKTPPTTDRRLASQLVLLGILIALPVATIATNGVRTLDAVLWSGAESARETPQASTSASPKNSESAPLRFGVYDPEGVFAEDTALQIRHIYISWAAFDEKELVERLRTLEQRGFQPFLTIEPWPQADSERPLLPAIQRGAYDPVIDRLAGALGELDGPVYVSWGHEMDQDLTERYPWSGSDPEHFVAAYRHVVDRIRAQVETPISWVWAGVLKQGSLQYWPGDEYADFIGMPVYSFPEWDRKTYGYIRSFRTTFEDKRAIVAELEKPLMLTELGVSGSADFESYWLRQAFLQFDDYPDLAGVVFFYAKDSEGAWGENVATPDWRLHPGVIRSLVDWKRR